MIESDLIAAAKKAQSNAYAPFSNFKVGAALLCDDERIFTGANVENSSYGLTNCAERSAVFAAVSAGQRKFKRIAIFSSCSPPATPCGACRQVLYEFAPQLEVICANDMGEISIFKLSELLPRGFRLEDSKPQG
jgi:cytidine deaminase